ncbi:hypothetical protein DASC09_024350 [Saccharomycopsis crataegensis]|uniref:FAD-binding FR-type domain-containing protein n=1 Tax=Saccharomycopsis crataegensis TaxID=43959 RepID=A0AAV5QJH4_9ASCO|nr:hypothetical protein DASC09_024350 [Saccharomycopsis crataegensis]
MLQLLNILIILSLINASLTSGKIVGDSDVESTIIGCQFTVKDYAFGCVPEDISKSFWECSCIYEPIITSIIDCFQDFVSETRLNEAIEEFSKYCSDTLEDRFELSRVDLWDIYYNGSNYIIDPVDKDDPLNDSTVPSNKTFYVPIKLDQARVKMYYNDMRIFNYNLSTSTLSGKVICYYWSIIFLGFFFYNSFVHNNSLSLLNKNRKFNKTIINKVKKYITIPNTIPNRHHFPCSFPILEATKIFSSALIPSRLETIIVTLYIILNIYLLVFGYQVNPKSSFFPTVPDQVARYLADRSGIIALDNVPILILLAGRNSILTWFTGLPYSSLIVYHKWISRGMVFNALIHSFLYLVISCENGTLGSSMRESYFIWGVIATLFGVAIILQAVHFLRSRWYETFLIIHIIFASIFLIGMINHCLEVGWIGYTVASISLWALDRLIRLIRILKFGIQKATIKLVGDTTLQLSVPKSCLKPYPGCYVFVYFWLPTTFWQSHPFCVIESVTDDNEVSIFIQVKEGITKKLYNYVQNCPNQAAKVNVSLEGPYGVYYNLEKYKTILFFAGGTGIPGPFYHLENIIRGTRKNNKPSQDGEGEGQQKQQYLKLYWSTKKLKDLEWFHNELKVLKSSRTATSIYLTREKDAKSATESGDDREIISMMEDGTENTHLLSSENSTFLSTKVPEEALLKELETFIDISFNRRPNIEKIMKQEFDSYQELGSVDRSIAIVFCGPAIMCDQIREVVAKLVDNYDQVIDIYEELQVW